jgi:hypothetical protein
LDKFYQITTKSVTGTLHTLYNHLNTPIVVVHGKGGRNIYMALLPDLPDAELVLHGKNMFLNRLKHGIGGGTTTSLQAN